MRSRSLLTQRGGGRKQAADATDPSNSVGTSPRGRAVAPHRYPPSTRHPKRRIRGLRSAVSVAPTDHEVGRCQGTPWSLDSPEALASGDAGPGAVVRRRCVRNGVARRPPRHDVAHFADPVSSVATGRRKEHLRDVTARAAELIDLADRATHEALRSLQHADRLPGERVGRSWDVASAQEAEDRARSVVASRAWRLGRRRR
jgi:hypothetical protein